MTTLTHRTRRLAAVFAGAFMLTIAAATAAPSGASGPAPSPTPGAGAQATTEWIAQAQK